MLLNRMVLFYNVQKSGGRLHQGRRVPEGCGVCAAASDCQAPRGHAGCGARQVGGRSGWRLAVGG